MQSKSTANIYINGVSADATLKSLRTEAAKLRNELATLSPTSEEFAKKAERFREVDGRIQTLNGNLKQTKGLFGQLQTELGKFGTLAIAYLGFDAITGKVGNMIRKNAELSDSMADVMKTTGMTEEEVKKLNKSFGEYDTRTARSELLALARDAGKLGITGKKDIEEFVRAADKINVALGEDLGKDAITQIGKLVSLFQLKEQFGLEQSMIKVASAMNTLGASSEASEGYITDFLNRMGGIAPMANISITEVMALGATLDSLGQTSEVSSTALSKMFTKMASDATTYARIAGVSTEEFRKMMNDNALGAFMMVLEAAGKTEGGLVQLTETLGDLGVEGGRATGVFGVLSKNTDLLKKQIDIANKSFEEGNSVVDEFNTKNNNLAANLEKLQKWLGGLFVNNAFLEGMKQMVNYAVRLINIPLSEKMEKERIELRKVELQLLNTNLPQAERLKLIRELQENYPEYFKHLDAERVSNRELQKAIKALNDEMINKIIIQREDEKIQRNNEVLAEKRINFLEREDKLRAQIIATAEKNNVQLKDGLNDVQQALYVLKQVESSGSPIIDYAKGRQQLAIAYTNYNNALRAMNQQEERGNLLLEEREALMKRLGIEQSDKQVFNSAVEPVATAPAATPTPGIPSPKDQDAAYKTALDKLNNFYNAEKALVKIKMADDLDNRETHETELLNLETRQLQARKNLLVQFKKDTSEVDLQIAENRIKLAEDEAKREAEVKKNAFQQIKNALAEEEALIHQNYANGIITEQQYQEQLQELKIGSLEILKVAHQAYGDDVANIEKQITEEKAKQAKLREKNARKTTDHEKALAFEILQAERQLTVARQENLTDLINASRGFFKENSMLAKAALIASKAAAIAEVVIKAQIEKAAASAASMLVDPTGTLGAIRRTIINARMGTSIALIGAQTIQELRGFSKGGFTGYGLGVPDKSGHKVAGVVHENEYVVPQWMLRQPQYANVVAWLENQRQNGGNYDGFSEGGMTRREARRSRRFTAGGTRINERNAMRAEIESYEQGTLNDLQLIELIKLQNEILARIEERVEEGLVIGDDQLYKMQERQQTLKRYESNATFR